MGKKMSDERLLITEALFFELENILGRLNPNQDLTDTIEYMEMIKRKMQLRYFDTNQPQILQQINKMESIIIRVREMQNKNNVTTM